MLDFTAVGAMGRLCRVPDGSAVQYGGIGKGEAVVPSVAAVTHRDVAASLLLWDERPSVIGPPPPCSASALSSWSWKAVPSVVVEVRRRRRVDGPSCAGGGRASCGRGAWFASLRVRGGAGDRAATADPATVQLQSGLLGERERGRSLGCGGSWARAKPRSCWSATPGARHGALVECSASAALPNVEVVAWRTGEDKSAPRPTCTTLAPLPILALPLVRRSAEVYWSLHECVARRDRVNLPAAELSCLERWALAAPLCRAGAQSKASSNASMIRGHVARSA